MRLRIYARAQCDEVPTEAWERLAHRALVKNPFYEHWNLLPALRHLDTAEHVELVTAWRGEELVALFPLHHGRKLPFFATAAVWKHDECYCTSPLLVDEAAWSQLLALLWRERRVQMLLSTTQVGRAMLPATGPHATRQSYRRAALDCSRRFDDIEQNWPRKRRKESRRLMRKAFEQSQGRYTRADDLEGCRRLFSAFLRVEASGWKGRAGSAIANNPDTRKYYEALVEAGAARGQVQTQLLSLDDTPVAASLRLVTGDRCFEVKTSFCEAHRSLSPGALLEVLNIQALTEGEWRQADSCSQAGNRLLESLWPDSLPVYNSVYFAPDPVARVAALLTKAFKAVKHRNGNVPTPVRREHQYNIAPTRVAGI